MDSNLLSSAFNHIISSILSQQQLFTISSIAIQLLPWWRWSEKKGKNEIIIIICWIIFIISFGQIDNENKMKQQSIFNVKMKESFSWENFIYSIAYEQSSGHKNWHKQEKFYSIISLTAKNVFPTFSSFFPLLSAQLWISRFHVVLIKLVTQGYFLLLLLSQCAQFFNSFLFTQKFREIDWGKNIMRMAQSHDEGLNW